MLIDHLLESYKYHLPLGQIAQAPVNERDNSRLMVLEPAPSPFKHLLFHNIVDLLQPGDLLVTNNSKVFPARLFGYKQSGGRVEVLLLNYPEPQKNQEGARALALIKSSKRPKPESIIKIAEDLHIRVEQILEHGQVKIRLLFRGDNPAPFLERHGQMPLPPYINRAAAANDNRRYQTRYAENIGSVAAPTAGLHFSDRLLAAIEERGIQRVNITLHVGYGTFAPVRQEDIRKHKIHREEVEISERTAEIINHTRDTGGRIWAVGTTTVRTLEYVGKETGRLSGFRGRCGLYIYPGYRFSVVDNLITNFHLPQSSLLFLVSALIGRDRILAAYQNAVAKGYRFFSYGDAMAIITRPVT
ncbi:MAG: tRNA preQ1(34) S-adenosylmethionine ribosyltransferase-isomerase QueA [Desulfobulbus propionicus]|nr:MAG: tRNA preQ1(34) S-adenosylmethionine ribosyltransferase-isomerase QueA [Desulfobulbus propionicus]